MTFDTHQSNPAGTFTAQYQKVGNIVHFHARFALSDEGSGMNSIHLSNLPFTPNVSSYTHPIATFYAEQGVNTGGANNMVFGKLVTNAYQFKVCEMIIDLNESYQLVVKKQPTKSFNSEGWGL